DILQCQRCEDTRRDVVPDGHNCRVGTAATSPLQYLTGGAVSDYGAIERSAHSVHIPLAEVHGDNLVALVVQRFGNTAAEVAESHHYESLPGHCVLRWE